MNQLIGPIVLLQLYLVYTGTYCAKEKGYSPFIGFVSSLTFFGFVYFLLAPSAVSTELDEPTKSRRKNLGNNIGGVIALVGLLGIIVFFAPSKWLTILDIKSAKRAHALLFPDSIYSELPEKVVISIDEVKAVFHKGDKSYGTLVSLLHNGHTSEMLKTIGAGNLPTRSAVQGELAIQSYGMTSHFMICSTEIADIWLIKLPDLNRLFHYKMLLFTADPRVIELVKEIGAKQSNIKAQASDNQLPRAEKSAELRVAELRVAAAIEGAEKSAEWFVAAAIDGELEKLRTMVKANISVNSVSRGSGSTALIEASDNGYEEVVKYLLEKCADVNIKRKLDGETALIAASAKGHKEVVILLLHNNANVNCKRKDGGTALTQARKAGHLDVVSLLIAAGAKE